MYLKHTISLALTASLILSGCGSTSSSGTTDKVFTNYEFVSSKDSALSLAKAQEDLLKSYQTLNNILLANDGVVDLSYQISQIDSNNEDLIKKIKLLDIQYFLMINAYKDVIIKSYNLNTYTKTNGLNFIVTLPTVIGVGVFAFGAYLSAKVLGNMQKNNDNKVISNTFKYQEGKDEVIKLLKAKGIDVDSYSTQSELLNKVKDLPFLKRRDLTRQLITFNMDPDLTQNNQLNVEVVTQYKKDVVETAYAAGREAVTMTVSGCTTITGGIGEAVGTVFEKELLGATVDAVLSLSSTDPLSILKDSTIITSKSKQTTYSAIPNSTKTLAQAKDILKKDMKSISENEFIESTNKLRSDVAGKSYEYIPNKLYMHKLTYIDNNISSNILFPNSYNSRFKYIDDWAINSKGFDLIITDKNNLDITQEKTYFYPNTRLNIEVNNAPAPKGPIQVNLTTSKIVKKTDRTEYSVTADISNIPETTFLKYIITPPVSWSSDYNSKIAYPNKNKSINFDITVKDKDVKMEVQSSKDNKTFKTISSTILKTNHPSNTSGGSNISSGTYNGTWRVAAGASCPKSSGPISFTFNSNSVSISYAYINGGGSRKSVPYIVKGRVFYGTDSNNVIWSGGLGDNGKVEGTFSASSCAGDYHISK